MSGNIENSPIKSTFEVYKESDFNNFNVDGNMGSTENLCKYYFSYIIYDTLELNNNNDKETYKYKYETKLDHLSKQIIANINAIKERGDKYEYINTFFNYAFTIFSVVSQGDIIDDNKTVSISQGQYLDHLDTIHERYKKIINGYSEENQKKKAINSFAVPDIIIKKNTIQSTDIISETKTEVKYYISFINEKYKNLDVYKKKNKFFITDISNITILKHGEEEDEYKNLYSDKNPQKNITNVIEDLLYFYYRYEFTYASINTLNIISDGLKNRARNSSLLCAIFSIFEKNNKNIIQLLLFKDKFFNKLIQKIDNTDTNADTNADTKNIMLEKYQMLEKKIRRAFLNDINEKKEKNEKFTQNPFNTDSTFISFYNIIKYRLHLYNGYDNDMKNVVDFYRPGRLIQYDVKDIGIGIGIISNVDDSQGKINIIPQDKDNLVKTNKKIVDILDVDMENMIIDINNIKDTDIIIGEEKYQDNTNTSKWVNTEAKAKEYQYTNFDFNKNYILHTNVPKPISEDVKKYINTIDFYKNYTGSLFFIIDYTIYPAQKKETLCNVPEEIYLSYFTIENDNTLTNANEKMMLITDDFIRYIFNAKTTNLYTEDYSKKYKKCILIEKIVGDSIIDDITGKYADKYNRLFFIPDDKEQEEEKFFNDEHITNGDIEDLE